MSVKYKLFKKLQKESESTDFVLDDKTKNKIKESFNRACIENSSISIVFSTKDFPRPIRLGFIKKRVNEVLSLLMPNSVILNDILISIEEAIANIYEHSYHNDDELIIKFQFILYSSKIIINIDDFGEKGRKFKLGNKGNYSSH